MTKGSFPIIFQSFQNKLEPAGKAGFLVFPDEAHWLKRSNNTNSSVLACCFFLTGWPPDGSRFPPVLNLKRCWNLERLEAVGEKKLLELQMWPSSRCPLTDEPGRVGFYLLFFPQAITQHFTLPVRAASVCPRLTLLTLQPCTALHTATYRRHTHTHTVTHHQMWHIKAQARAHHRALL